ncbi:hypothetical protein AVEN_229902-1 [Araneus ventricosus]|uniref:Integrase catalytic domain-containing protein n=1 Tax=Araneus ventricosus TaxID=182803 RepID=A0A4Y2U9M5_ARAVE|nr:hypothetical protein AVEN_229902-1 [Araneus ventricosus]
MVTIRAISLKTFVANRVSEIQSILPSEVWNHIRGKVNTADFASRAFYPQSLNRIVYSGEVHHGFVKMTSIIQINILLRRCSDRRVSGAQQPICVAEQQNITIGTSIPPVETQSGHVGYYCYILLLNDTNRLVCTLHYICLFVYFTTKAVHREIVGDLTSEAFIAALKRFIGRRGKPTEIYSDCGTNFIAADGELRRVVASLRKDEPVKKFFADKSIRWKFTPFWRTVGSSN